MMGCNMSPDIWGDSLNGRRNSMRYGWTDWNFCKRQIAHDGCLIRNVPEKMRTHNLCLAAVRQNGMALKFISNQTPEICRAAVEQNPDALQYVDKRFRPEIEEESTGPSPR